MIKRFAIIVSLALLGPVAAQAQDYGPDREQQRYDRLTVQLAEVMGGLHYLRGLCAYDRPAFWRDRMNDFMALDEPTGERRTILVEAFNGGFARAERDFYDCTRGALKEVRFLSGRGAELAADLAADLEYD